MEKEKKDDFDPSENMIKVLVKLYRDMSPGSTITIYIHDGALFVNEDGVAEQEGVLTISKPSVVTCLGINLEPTPNDSD